MGRLKYFNWFMKTKEILGLQIFRADYIWFDKIIYI
jgi:hypothetical protein